MSNFLCIWPNWFGTGLSNQLFLIIAAIIRAHKEKIPLVIFERFRTQPCTEMFVPLKDVIDLNHLNQIISKYNVSVLDKYGTNLSLVSVKYGTNDLKINITEEISKDYLKENKLFIPKSVYLNNIKGDPVLGQPKKIFITYKINEFVFTETFDEHHRPDISIDLTFYQQFRGLECVDVSTYDPIIFNNLLKSIKFTNLYNNISNSNLLIDKNDKYIINNFHNDEKELNVIHLRLENDWTHNLSKINEMTEKEFIENLENIYIELIKKFFSKNSRILVLTYDRHNNVIKFLKDNDYEFYTSKKNIFDGREQHAIIDLLIGERCNGYFIANWNYNNNDGSTFSYVLSQRMNKNVKILSVDNNNIKAHNIENSLIIR
jgi:hypothetical protein